VCAPCEPQRKRALARGPPTRLCGRWEGSRLPQLSALVVPLPGRRASGAGTPHGGTRPGRRQRIGAQRQRFSCDARYYLRLTVLHFPLCRSRARTQVWSGTVRPNSVDNAEKPRDPGASWCTQRFDRDNGARRPRMGKISSAAPSAAHALADALRSTDDAMRGHEPAHPAGIGRQAAAVGTGATEIARADDLAIASGIEAGWLRTGFDASKSGRAAGDQSQYVHARHSHRDSPGAIVQALSANTDAPATAAGPIATVERPTVPRRQRSSAYTSRCR
jgi:hypothetical protein